MLKGKACVNCRRRKIKCDGEKPVCGQCARSNGSFEDCEYPGGGPTQTQILEERINHVQSRIHELENPSDIASVPLHHPYDPANIASFDFVPGPSWSGPSYSRGSSRTTRSPMTTPPPVSRSPALRSISTATLTHIQEPPPDVMQLVADAFYQHCPRFGFFLNIERFHRSFLLQYPVGHPARPSAALISAVFLWGTHLSPALSETYDERAFLRNTLHYLSKDLSSSHPHKVLHGIQAEVLLSYYYLKNGKVLEGNYHANAAVSLSLSAGLHRIRTPGTSYMHQGNTRPDSALPCPTDGIEEGERIDAFWAVLVLNNYWVAIQESHLMFYDLQNVEVDTPWPMDSTEYELHLLPRESRGTIKSFLENTSIEGMSITALHAKAAVLLEQATVLRTHSKKPASYSEALIQLDSLIDQFKSNFPLLDRFNSRAPGRETLLITQMMAHVATIKLHQPFADNHKHSRDKSLFSAQSIAGLTRDVMSTRSLQIDPILGVLWTSACEVIMQEMSRPAANHGQWMPFLQIMLSQMTKFSVSSVLMKFLVTRLQRKYAATVAIW